MLESSYFSNYKALSKKIIQFGENPPLKLKEKYEQTMDKLHKHLYDNKIFMPLAQYPYNEKDISTHAFIKHPTRLGSIINPRYKYKKVWRRIDGAKLKDIK